MNRKYFAFLILLLLTTFWVQFKPVRAYQSTITVPSDYPTIQQAINAAGGGDTVLVHNGTYFERIVVNKSISLVGEDRDTTIVDGGGNGTVVKVEKDGVKISGLTLTNAGYGLVWTDYSGIKLAGVLNSTIENTSIRDSSAGINLLNSSDIKIHNSSISGNHFGVVMQASNGTVMRDNNLAFNNVMISGRRGSNLKVFGDSMPSFIHDIDSSNSVDGKPIYYMVNQQDREVPSDGGFVALVGSVNMSVQNSHLQGLLIANTNNSLVQTVSISNSSVGIEMLFSNSNKIANSTIQSNDWGILLVDSHDNSLIGNSISESTNWGIGLGGPNGSDDNLIQDNLITDNSRYGVDVYGKNNTIARNDISHNSDGLLLDASLGNTIVDNNIMNNSRYGLYLIRDSQDNIIAENSIEFNDYGIFVADISENNTMHHNNFIGNTYQTLISVHNVWDDGLEGNYWNSYLGSDNDEDGIWDAPYVINQNNKDNFPLAGIFYRFDASDSSVTIISNSTVLGFQFNQTAIKFNVAGNNGTVGFCRVRIPKTLLGAGPYTVTVDGFPPLLLKELAATNDTYEYLYFRYAQKTNQEVLIVPELPIPAILMLVIAFSTSVVILNRRRHD